MNDYDYLPYINQLSLFSAKRFLKFCEGESISKTHIFIHISIVNAKFC